MKWLLSNWFLFVAGLLSVTLLLEVLMNLFYGGDFNTSETFVMVFIVYAVHLLEKIEEKLNE